MDPSHGFAAETFFKIEKTVNSNNAVIGISFPSRSHLFVFWSFALFMLCPTCSRKVPLVGLVQRNRSQCREIACKCDRELVLISVPPGSLPASFVCLSVGVCVCVCVCEGLLFLCFCLCFPLVFLVFLVFRGCFFLFCFALLAMGMTAVLVAAAAMSATLHISKR